MNIPLTMLLTTWLMMCPIADARGQDRSGAQEQTDAQRQSGTQADQENKEKGEVDLLLDKLKTQNDRVLGRCLENCKESEGAIAGGVADGKIINKAQPAYPVVAKSARATGAVAVRVVVDEEGVVMAAQAASGHALLRAAAVKAAKETRFTPTLLEGRPVKVSGVIIYNFILQ